VANQKGGVGKSTTAVSIGAALAELGRKVLVVDLDPQGNASTGMGIRHEVRDVTVYDVLAAEAPIDGAVVQTPVSGLFAIPSTIDLAGAEIELVSQFSRELRLRKALEPLKEGSYDFIFLDCPPSLGLLTVNALAAAEELIVPIQCEYYALEGLGQLLRNVRLVQQNVNPNLKLTGIVMTMFDPRTKLSEQVVDEVRRFFGKRVYRTIIPRTVRLSEAPGFGQPITVYDPKSRGAERYRELAKEVASRRPPNEPIPVFDELRVAIEPPSEPEPSAAPHPLVEAEDQTAKTAGRGEPVEGAEEAVEVPEPLSEAPESTEIPDSVSEPAAEEEVGQEPEGGAEVETGPAAVAGETGTSSPALGSDRAVGEGDRELPTVQAVEVEIASSPSEPPAEPQGGVDSDRPVEPEPPGGSEVPGEAEAIEGPERWMAEFDAQAQEEAERAAREKEPEPAPVREISLEPELEVTDGVDPDSVVVIEDRDAAGRHGPAPGGGVEGGAEGRGKRRWSLFRRGGDR
jgi:chromosome partitioning protein